MVVVVHDCLYLPLVVVPCDWRPWLAILVPEAVNGALARALLPFCILTAFSFWLLRSNFDGVRSPVRLLLWLLLFICSAQILSNHNGILIQGGVGPHGHAVACLARRELPIMIRLVVDVTQRRVRLLRLLVRDYQLLAHLV